MLRELEVYLQSIKDHAESKEMNADQKDGYRY